MREQFQFVRQVVMFANEVLAQFFAGACREAETDSLAGKTEMDNMRCRVQQDQEPDIDEVLSRQGVERIY